MRRAQPITAAAIAVALALLVAAAWCGRARAPVAQSAVDSTVSVRIVRHDAYGMPIGAPAIVRDPVRVRAIVEALGVDSHSELQCPPDYASAELGLQLNGRDVYAKRNVYIWDVKDEASPDAKKPDGGNKQALVVAVNATGCRGGPPADVGRLRQSLFSALEAANLDGGNSGKRQ